MRFHFAMCTFEFTIDSLRYGYYHLTETPHYIFNTVVESENFIKISGE